MPASCGPPSTPRSSHVEPIARIQALIARALDMTGTTEEERRSSAIVACRMIREHCIVLFTPNELESHNAGLISDVEDQWERRLLAEREKAKAQFPWSPQQRPGPRRNSGRVRAQVAGFCLACRKPYDADEAVKWRRLEGIVHARCSWDDVELDLDTGDDEDDK